ncbi:MAG TPA: hypothetical protein VFJ89_03690 [Nocardioides sp.]|jgi:hypothetical protein|nr:hypothetical protein [Nocardioides sp.]
MMSIVIVCAALAVVVGALLAVDWFVAGRTKRQLVRARDPRVGDLGVDLGVIESQAHSTRMQGDIPL